MFESIKFQNFKALRDATLKLRPFNLIVGPNGSGKSTVFQALEAVSSRAAVVGAVSGWSPLDFNRFLTAGVKSPEIKTLLKWPTRPGVMEAEIACGESYSRLSARLNSAEVTNGQTAWQEMNAFFSSI